MAGNVPQNRVFTVVNMAINWMSVRSKLTHFGGIVFAYFWMRYTFDDSFRVAVGNYIHHLPFWVQGLIGFALSFYAWYRNPNRVVRSDQSNEERKTGTNG